MRSPLLALFTRSLREDERNRATFWGRAGLAGLLLLILGMTALSSGSGGAPGRSYFIASISLQALAITFAGLNYFVSAIVEEKEEHTLGLLRMTDLDPLSILLGKSTSRFCTVLLLFVAPFPFTMYAVTLGGISLGQITAAYCTVIAYTFLLANVALLGSVIAKRVSGAVIFTVVVMAFLFGIGPLIWAGAWILAKLGMPTSYGQLGMTLWDNTPIARLIAVLSTGFSGQAVDTQVLSNLFLGGLFFLFAWSAFSRFCDQASEAGEPTGKPRRVIRKEPMPRPDTNPIRWKDYHFLYGGNDGLLLRGAVYLGIPLALYFMSDSNGSSVFMAITSTISSIVLLVSWIDLAAMTARAFRSEIDQQTLSALAILPQTMRETAYAKGRALLIAAIPAILLVVGGGLLRSFNRNQIPAEMAPMMLMQCLFLAAWMVLLMHLVFCLSLQIKRGAVPVGFVISYALNMIGSVFVTSWLSSSALTSTYLTPFIMALINLSVAALLHFRGLRRLETIAAGN